MITPKSSRWFDPRALYARAVVKFEKWLGVSFNVILKDVLEKIRTNEVYMAGETWVPNAYIIYVSPGIYLELVQTHGEQAVNGFAAKFEEILNQEVILEEGQKIIELEAPERIYVKLWRRGGLEPVVVDPVHLAPAAYRDLPGDKRSFKSVIDQAFERFSWGYTSEVEAILNYLLPIAPLHTELVILKALVHNGKNELDEAVKALLYLHKRNLRQQTAQGFVTVAEYNLYDPAMTLLSRLEQQSIKDPGFVASIAYYKTVLEISQTCYDYHDLDDYQSLLGDWQRLQSFERVVKNPWLVPSITLPFLVALLNVNQQADLALAFNQIDWSTWVDDLLADSVLNRTVNSWAKTEELLAQQDYAQGFPHFWLAHILAARNPTDGLTKKIRTELDRAHRRFKYNNLYRFRAKESRSGGWRKDQQVQEADYVA